MCNLDFTRLVPAKINFQEFKSTWTWNVWLIIFFPGLTHPGRQFPSHSSKEQNNRLEAEVGYLLFKMLEKKGDIHWDWCVQLMRVLRDPMNKNASVFIQSCPQEDTVLVHMPGYYGSSSSRAGVAIGPKSLEKRGGWGTHCSNVDSGPPW